MKHMKHVLLLSGVLVTSFSATAQTAAPDLLRPWAGDQIGAEFRADATIFNQANASVSDAGVDLSRYDAHLRARPDQVFETGEYDVVFSARVQHAEFSSADPLIPQRLVDTHFGIGVQREIQGSDGWSLGATLGIGHASATPFGDENGLYLTGDVLATHQLGGGRWYTLALTYNGNGSIFPDAPLPSFAYTDASNRNFVYTLGLPFNSLTWTPAEDLTVELGLFLLNDGRARVSYLLADELTVFASYRSRNDAFASNALANPNDRIFFRQRLVEAGLTWSPHPNAEITAAVGFAFDQDLDFGFDVRDLSTLRDLSDEGFIRIGGQIKF